MFVIEDEQHAELQDGEYLTCQAAFAKLKQWAAIPWNESPNKAPCTSWRTCGRTYEIVEYDTSTLPWQELQRIPVLNVAAKGIVWLSDIAE